MYLYLYQILIRSGYVQFVSLQIKSQFLFPSLTCFTIYQSQSRLHLQLETMLGCAELQQILTPTKRDKQHTLKCLSIGTPKTINFPFVPNGKLIDFRCPNIQAHHNLAVMCLKFGTPKYDKFFIWDKWKINYFRCPNT